MTSSWAAEYPSHSSRILSVVSRTSPARPMMPAMPDAASMLLASVRLATTWWPAPNSFGHTPRCRKGVSRSSQTNYPQGYRYRGRPTIFGWKMRLQVLRRPCGVKAAVRHRGDSETWSRRCISYCTVPTSTHSHFHHNCISGCIG